MKHLTYSKWLNALWYECIWFTAILGKEQYHTVLAFLLLAHAIWLVQQPLQHGLFVLVCALIGMSFDSVLTALGIFQFETRLHILPLPFWLIAIWLGFTATLNHSLQRLFNYPYLLILLAALCAPLTYWAGERLGAVDFPWGTLPTLFVIGVGWGSMVTLFVVLRRWLLDARPYVQSSTS